MRIATTPRVKSGRRGGFTLIEMFVVMAIIAVLVALTASAVIYLMGWGPSAGTKATLRKADSAVRQEWIAARDTAKDECAGGFPSGTVLGTVLQAANGNPDLAKQLWIFLRLHQEFPTSFAEAGNGYNGVGLYTAPNGTQVPMPPKAFYTKAVTGIPPDAQTGPPARESAALLLLAISPQARRGQAVPVEDALGRNAIQNINGIAAIVDSWGKPVQFQVVVVDPLNPPNPPTSWPYLNPDGSPQSTPVIISAGPNLTFGDGDDLSSFDLRQSTTGGN
jgi:prepilin-type N-terminal cleavage/methylation domain-containing protein